ncbi:hypothetical protein ASG21_06950 [Chryseobacterium sp. Leaf394]|nr:hypothetical protein ASG21_06950 [Chryseobacterium sp. Leaf394]
MYKFPNLTGFQNRLGFSINTSYLYPAFYSKQIAGNKMRLQDVSNKLWETKFTCRKSQTICGKQNAIAGSLEQLD